VGLVALSHAHHLPFIVHQRSLVESVQVPRVRGRGGGGGGGGVKWGARGTGPASGGYYVCGCGTCWGLSGSSITCRNNYLYQHGTDHMV